MNADARRAVYLKVALAIGFLALGLGVAIAYNRPATGYELSIYAATPVGFWIGIAVATIAALVVAVGPDTPRELRTLGLALGAGSVLSILSLPIIRNYYFYGAGDSMSHLGWGREIGGNVLDAYELLYPGIHIMANFIADLSGFGLNRTFQYIPLVVFPLLTILFVTLCVRYLTDSRWATVIGLFSALLFIPINGLSLHFMPHPSSQAVLYLPLVLYLVFRFVTEPSDRFAFASPVGAALAIVAVATVFIHPQESMELVILLGTIAIVQLAYRRYRPDDRIATHKSLLAHALLTFLVFIAWVPQHSRPRARIMYMLEGFLSSGTTTGTETAGRLASLTALGGSLEELFLKIFGVTMVFSILAAILMSANLLGRLDERTPDRRAFVTYLTAALVPLTLIFLVVFVANQGDHYFRFLGFIMVPVTILGAAALAELVSDLELSVASNTVATGLVVIFVVMLALQGLTFHQSPHVYQPNQQVTEGAVEGFTVAFEHRVEDRPFASTRRGPRRYVDAYYGRDTARSGLDFPGYRGGVSGEEFNQNLASNFDESVYFTTIESNYKSELGLYDGLRYSEEGFRTLETEQNIYRVQDNGDFNLYVIRDEE